MTLEDRATRELPTTRIRHVPGIDGLRALAVISVMVYHFWPQVLPGGFLGVDIFFVLSGFLITSLIIREIAVTHALSFTNFWKRRLRRIVPAAAAVLMICTFIAGLVGGDSTVNLGTQFFSTLFFVNNWAQISNAESYFADQGVQIFAHYWSLSIEEQFYLLWPIIIFTIAALSKKYWSRNIGVLAAIGTVASAILMAVLYIPGEDPTRVYYGTDTHIFGLLLGAALATAVTSNNADNADSFPRPPSVVRLLTIPIGFTTLGILILALFMVDATSSAAYRGMILGCSILTTILLYCILAEIGPLKRLFQHRLAGWIGQRSFSLYLWHWPLIVIIRETAPQLHPLWQGLLATALSILLASLSYTYIENPFRRHGYIHIFKKLWTWPIIAALLITSLIGLKLAPEKSKLETDLSRIQQERQERTRLATQTTHSASDDAEEAKDKEKETNSKQKTTESSSKQSTPMDTPVSKRRAPQGNTMTAVGDSVMLASAEALERRFPGIYVDADVSRAWVAGIPIIQTLKDAGQLGDFVIMGFGTNGYAWDGQIEELTKIVGQDRVLILLAPYGARDWIPQSQQDAIEAAKKYPNVYVAPWCDLAKDNTEALYEDGIHPTPDAGADIYAEAVNDAIQQWVKGKKTTTTCG